MVSQLINYPKMFISDEPMNGLDPVINNKMKELIKNVVKNKKNDCSLYLLISWML